MFLRNGTGIGVSNLDSRISGVNFKFTVSGESKDFDLDPTDVFYFSDGPQHSYLRSLRMDYRTRFFDWRYSLYSSAKTR